MGSRTLSSQDKWFQVEKFKKPHFSMILLCGNKMHRVISELQEEHLPTLNREKDNNASFSRLETINNTGEFSLPTYPKLECMKSFYKRSPFAEI
ncbi:hypothetical protein AVEN_42354-1 [Araneus ventricosus]|uniref:Uncharacterized protein n=1 Tax=Araneus ventricosus TaxID=182803 RepID=A0A4Y2JLY8_ARAVE|nr:hypothetical protein AVEN_42354-1 [Araneus ventricosus]